VLISCTNVFICLLGWMIVCGWVNSLGMYYVTSQLDWLSFPSLLGWWMSTNFSWEVNRQTVRCTSPVSVVLQYQLMSGWGLWKRRLAPPSGPKWLEKDFLFYLFSKGTYINYLHAESDEHIITRKQGYQILAVSQNIFLSACLVIFIST